ncbi:MAG: hypothetical protein LBQ90_07845 [Synergistaceae bacterium]|jgi:hypothetical protein|nr:hypothetical protein [Synergistaceae bacterium]
MEWIPIDKVVESIQVRDAREEGMEAGMEKMVRSFLANGVSPEIAAKSAGWSLKDVKALMN